VRSETLAEAMAGVQTCPRQASASMPNNQS